MILKTLSSHNTNMTSSESIPKLNSDGTNFLLWKRKLNLVLQDKNIAYVLTDPKPETPTCNFPDENDTKEWDHDDATCRDIILSSIDDNFSVMYQDRMTAKSLMDDLMVHFKPTFSRRIALYRQYFNHKMEDGCHIGRHIAQMGAMAAELEAMGVELSETVKVMVLIESLPKSWKDEVLSDGMLTRTDPDEGPKMQVVIERLRSLGDTMALGRSHIGIRLMVLFSLAIGIISKVF